MFIFGSAEDTRDLYLSNAMANDGPDLPSTSFDELNRMQQKALFAYVYMTYSDALRDELRGDRLDKIVELYDDVFRKLAEGHADFCEAVLANRHVYLPDYSPETRAKYNALASSALNSLAT